MHKKIYRLFTIVSFILSFVHVITTHSTQAVTLPDIEEYDIMLVRGYMAPKYGHSWMIFNPSNTAHQYHLTCQTCGKTAPPPTWMTYDKIPKHIETTRKEICVPEYQNNERELEDLSIKIGKITLNNDQIIALPTKLIPEWHSLKYTIIRSMKLEETMLAQEMQQPREKIRHLPTKKDNLVVPTEEGKSLFSTVKSLREIKLQQDEIIKNMDEAAEESTDIIKQMMKIVGIKTEDFGDCTGNIFAKKCLNRLEDEMGTI